MLNSITEEKNPMYDDLGKDGIPVSVSFQMKGHNFLQIWETYGGLRRHKVMNQEFVVRGDVILLEIIEISDFNEINQSLEWKTLKYPLNDSNGLLQEESNISPHELNSS